MKRLSKVHAWIIAAAVATAAALLVPTAAAAIPSGCTLNFVAGTHNCTGVPGITVLSFGSGRAVVKLTIPVGSTSHISATYNATPSGYTVNIGDSQSNDGGGGDGGNQSNDAEMMIQNQVMSLFGRDGTVTAPLLTVPNAALASGKTASFEVSDRKFCWDFANYTCAISDRLYALNGEPDTEGPVNYDIYVSFNRVIGRTDRNGTGVSSATVSPV